ncbi:hypothetical protein AB1K84_15485 [Mesobacillus foraminis]|uniref:hypothetical protein n=1 Tax=Mesobacillus foraminis TaxID=279826 RepID=UPI0039A1624A
MSEETSIKVITDLVKHAAEWDDKIDEVFKPVKDYSETLGDVIYPVKIALSTLTLANKLKFKRFLGQFASGVSLNNMSDDYIKRLERYLKKEVNLEYIAEVIDSSIKSRSSRCSAIMGYYAGVILNELKDIQYKDMVVLNALTVMNNIDLEYFMLLFQRFSSLFTSQNLNHIRVHDMPDEFNSLGVPVFEMENTIEKLKNVQLIGYDVGGFDSVGNAWGAFKFNEYTDYFFEIINKSGVMNIVETE